MTEAERIADGIRQWAQLSATAAQYDQLRAFALEIEALGNADAPVEDDAIPLPRMEPTQRLIGRLGTILPPPVLALPDGWEEEQADYAAAIAAAEARGRCEALLAVRRLREMGTAARDVGVFYDALDDLLRAHGLTVDE